MSESQQFDSKRLLSNLTHRPGVYRMYDASDTLIYVGKGKDLKKRVASYFGARAKDTKTMALVERIARMDVTVTNTETEALLLEHTLIKAHKPRFNVLLRDDKSYPWIYLNTKHDFPRLSFYRGPRRKGGRFFGPYPNSGAVRETLNELQKLFLLRPCRDSFFANRSRACLQYQINRCSAPCVGLIEKEAYASDLENALAFLKGQNKTVIDRLAVRMDEASQKLNFEEAARLRDQIARLKHIEAGQIVAGAGNISADIAGYAERGAIRCVAVLSIRRGKLIGSQSFFPRAPADNTESDIMAAFLGQYYLDRDIPAEVVIACPIAERALMEESFSERSSRKVQLRDKVRGDRAKWLDMAATNAQEAAALKAAEKAGIKDQLSELADNLQLDSPPKRIECFDISHTSGEATVASCVVFGEEGPLKSDYRRFNIKADTGGDDYLAMEEAIRRRYSRVRDSDAPMPDLVLIDGGKGQLGRAVAVMGELGLDEVRLIGVAKGRSRRPGAEQLVFPGQSQSRRLPPDSSALLLIQNIRDEAHRFAITAHRNRRSSARNRSPLEEISGLGPKRRRELLRQFGGMQGIEAAGIDDLARTSGISRVMAQKIYNRFHGSVELPSDVRDVTQQRQSE